MNDLNAKIKEFTNVARKFGRRNCLSDERLDDFVQCALESRFVRCWHQNLNQILSVFLREEFGSYRSIKGRMASEARRKGSDDFDGAQVADVGAEDDSSKSLRIDRAKQALLSNLEAQIVSLLSNGFRAKETAEVLGLKSPRLSQHLKCVKDKLSLLGVNLNQELEVDWISL